MLKKHSEFFSSALKTSDIFMVVLSWALAYWIRFHLLPNADSGLLFSFVSLTPALALLSLYFSFKQGLYNSQRLSSTFNETIKILQANAYSTLAFIVVLYFFSEDRISRLTLLLYFLISSVMLVFSRISMRKILKYLRSQGYNLRHVVLVGDGVNLEAYHRHILENPEIGIRIIDWIDAPDLVFQGRSGKSLKQVLHENSIDTIVLGYSATKSAMNDDVIRQYHSDLIEIQILPEIKYSLVGYHIEDFAGLPVLNLNQPNISEFDRVLKRFIDLVASAIGLILISPFLAFIALMVKVTSPGPIFYGQVRIGMDGKEFKMWKFRSMKVQTENAQPGWTTENDPRRTKFGTFIRKTSLDELPQLWNVFVGDMSLVGPRPEQPYFVEKFRGEIPAYMLRHKMKAGITGWAQVNGWRGDTSIAKRIECDIYYIKNWSLWLDIRILFLTFWRGFINKNAY